MSFDTYPDQPGFAAGSDTSQNAADKLTLRDELHTFISNRLEMIYPAGMTVDEMKVRVEQYFNRDFDRSTIAARFTELADAKVRKIIALEETRLTPRNRPAHVYVANTGQVIPKSAAETKNAVPYPPVHKMAQLLWDCVKINKDGSATITLAPLDFAIVETYAVEAGLKRG